MSLSTLPRFSEALVSLTPTVKRFDKNIQKAKVASGIENITLQFLRSFQSVFLSENPFSQSDLLNTAMLAQSLHHALKQLEEPLPARVYFMQKYFSDLVIKVLPELKKDMDIRCAEMQPEVRARIETSEFPYGDGSFEAFAKTMEDLYGALKAIKIPLSVELLAPIRSTILAKVV